MTALESKERTVIDVGDAIQHHDRKVKPLTVYHNFDDFDVLCSRFRVICVWLSQTTVHLRAVEGAQQSSVRALHPRSSTRRFVNHVNKICADAMIVNDFWISRQHYLPVLSPSSCSKEDPKNECKICLMSSPISPSFEIM